MAAVAAAMAAARNLARTNLLNVQNMVGGLNGSRSNTDSLAEHIASMKNLASSTSSGSSNSSSNDSSSKDSKSASSSSRSSGGGASQGASKRLKT